MSEKREEEKKKKKGRKGMTMKRQSKKRQSKKRIARVKTKPNSRRATKVSPIATAILLPQSPPLSLFLRHLWFGPMVRNMFWTNCI
jgi:hypothetical protein